MTVHVDWSGPNGAKLTVRAGDPIVLGSLPRCVECGRPALLRNPQTGKPEHKVCEERRLEQVAAGSASAQERRQAA